MISGSFRRTILPIELMEDNKSITVSMRKAHSNCENAKDGATASLLEVYIDETERRTWFLFEAANAASQVGH